jgi:dUTP pyrophosphatase
MGIEVINKLKYQLPQYSTEDFEDMDLRASLNNVLVSGPKERVLVTRGIFMEIPVGYEAQLRLKSERELKMV